MAARGAPSGDLPLWRRAIEACRWLAYFCAYVIMMLGICVSAPASVSASLLVCVAC